MSSAPDHLYDDDPQPIHTGEPRSRRRLLSLLLGVTVVIAAAAAWLLPLVTGSATEQSEEVAGVFVKALAAGDTETAYGLLCDAERARITPDEVAATYLRPGQGTVVGSTKGRVDGGPIVTVEIRWSGAGAVSSSELTMVPQNGARVCGTAPAG